MTNRTYSTTNEGKAVKGERLLRIYGRCIRLADAIAGIKSEGVALGHVYGTVERNPKMKAEMLTVTKGPHKGKWLQLKDRQLEMGVAA